MSVALPRGTKLAGFVLDAPLGQGGFGITYRAHAPDGSRDYAIKEYFPESFARRAAENLVLPKPGDEAVRLFEAGRKAFLNEAYVLRDLPRQPGLVRVRGAFEKNGTAYCLMDFIAGEPLDKVAARLITRRGHMPEKQVIALLETLGAALGAVHAAGFVHCDIKPANVMIGRDGTPVLIDFGAARRLGGARAGSAMLSRRYAAIEQFPRPNKGISLSEGPWTDIYCLAVMLYELVSQSAPPDAEARARERAAHRPDPCVPIRENLRRNRVEASYSAELLDLLDRGVALWPRDRPQSAAEFRMPAEQRRSRETGAPPLVSQGPPALSRDWRKIATMLTLILGLALLAAGYGLTSGGVR